MITILCVGKLKEQYWKDAVIEYQKRLTKYTKLEVIEVMDSNLPFLQGLQQEQEQLQKYIHKEDYVITLEINGKTLTSEEFSQKIENDIIHHSHIVFIIGGSNGISEEIKKRSNYSLSFSKMTFPHQLFRILLLEQIYRSFKIIKNESYHK